MAKYGDPAWTLPEPGGILDQTTPVDLRLVDSSYTAPPAGGWNLPGGSAPIKVPFPHDPFAPGAPLPSDIVVTADSGTTTLPSVLTLSGVFLDSEVIDFVYDTDLTASNINQVPVTGNMSAAGAAILAAAALTQDAEITAVAVGDTIEVVASGGAGGVDMWVVDVVPAP